MARPDGTLQCYRSDGLAGLLVTDLDLTVATGLLAKRLRITDPSGTLDSPPPAR